MGISRRNALIGIGTVAAGAGVIGASGAFTQVEADRSVTVETQGDAGGALSLVPAEDGEENHQYVGDSGDIIELDFTQLNLQAVTTVDPLLDVGNNSENVVDLTVEVSGDDFADNIEVRLEGEDTEEAEITVGDDVELGFVFDVPSDADVDEFDLTLTLTAETQT